MNSPTSIPTTLKPLEQSTVRRSVDAEALLRSLAPVVARPDTRPEPAATPEPQPAKAARRTPAPQPAVRRWVPTDDEADDMPQQAPAHHTRKPGPTAGPRATMDVAINPGEGSTAIYVRVPRTTHMALKLLGLQNQAAMEGPTELASLVRTAIDEYLRRQKSKLAA